ncbi:MULTISPECIES: hypothetical protein [unclassified Nocardioides]|uniref:hypothetical protein n=1 Tax=unclassified Nocardioides TaxID=2615069 RepID=UPI00114F012D|nr:MULTISPECIES: hypothetical protein [unclassified Nocardioides]TQK70760.1 hypothetical protein FBY23_2541 [Nocardioides sp. SLBN-35]WGX99852.1 hypothetical protein QI633_15035 [Nocardioides sp. QY071]
MTRSGVLWSAVAVLVVAVLGVAGWRLFRADSSDVAEDPPRRLQTVPAGAPITWDHLSVAAEDRLVVGYGGSACQESNGNLVEEHPDRVVITAYAQDSAQMCILVLERYEMTVELAAPLGERAVYDGACLSQTEDVGAGAAPDPRCLRTPA